MELDQGQVKFIERRGRLVRVWPCVGSVCLLMLVGLGVWLYLKTPLLVDPFEVGRRLGGEGIEQGTLEVMAMMLPVMFLTCLFLMGAMVFFVFVGIAKEKRLLGMIERLRGGEG